MLPVTSLDFISVQLCCKMSSLTLDSVLTTLDNPPTTIDYHVMAVKYNNTNNSHLSSAICNKK